MKYLLTVFCLLIIISCTKPNEEEDLVLERELEHFELGFDLDEPDTILNDLAKGQLDRNIQAVLRQHHDNFPEPVERYWEFHYLPNSDKITEMIFYSVHYGHCEQTNYKFFYNQNELIDSIVLKRVNVCNEFEVDRIYSFNYSDIGLLKSVFMDNEFSMEENYFGYYPNGKIKEIYSSYRNKGTWEPNFGVQKFFYDEAFSNVIRHENIGISSHYTYQYFYDDRKNPFKDFYIAASVFLPIIGPAYLSENNVVKMIKQMSITDNSFPYEYNFNFQDATLDTYSDKNVDKMPYIFFKVNP